MLRRMRSSLFLKIQFLLVFAYIFLSSKEAEAQGDENYNFYIQKAPGPVIVNQGTKGNTDDNAKALKQNASDNPLAAAGAENQITQSAENSTEEANVEKRWGLGLNYGYIRDAYRFEGQSMLGFDLEYIVNRYLAFGGGMLFHHNLKEKYNRSYGGGYKDRGTHEWFARASVMPLRLNLFGRELLAIGGVAGFMSGYKANENLAADDRIKHGIDLFFGPAVDVQINSHLALRAEGHFNSTKTYQAVGGLKVRF